MDIHIGKAILKQLEQTGMSKSEFGRRINRAPQTVQDIISKPSIDTNLLQAISKVLGFNFFTLYTSGETATLGDASQPKDKFTKLTAKITELVKVNEKLITVLTKGQPAKKTVKKKN